MELEHFFPCPHCAAEVSVLLDVSKDGEQNYIEDCEVCCRPMALTLRAEEGDLTAFQVDPA